MADRLLPLQPSTSVRETARQAVLDMLAAEKTVDPAPVHGDLGTHNTFSPSPRHRFTYCLASASRPSVHTPSACVCTYFSPC